MNVRVVKIGGAALMDSVWLRQLAFTAFGSTEPLVIVHGGGPEITALSEQLGIEVEWSNGKRVTPPAALDAASMVLNGRMNKRIVNALLNAGVDALGLSGEDGGLVVGDLIEDGALGRVGKVASVRTELIEWLLGRGLVPVISPISRGSDGEPLNINADEVAAAIASELGAAELVFLTDVAGVLEDGAVRPSLDAAEAEAMLSNGVATGGMAVKLRAALAALSTGVAKVRIGDFSVLSESTAGTALQGAGVEVAA